MTLASAMTMTFLLVSAPPAAAASSVTARGVSLAPSASCRYGDVDVDYSATGAEKQHVELRSGTTVLNSFTVAAYRADYTGTEHILSRATPPAAPGTELTVSVTIGTDPPTAATTAEFLITYRCTAAGNDAGGQNVVVASCFGAYGSCQPGPPATDPPPPTDPPTTVGQDHEDTPTPPATPIVVAPQFTG